ncbi:hypothetical protein ACFQDG_11410 [Natronoarchaeum mannanilyticum]|uniref:DUF7115 domain-containing protein n=1 Tax=Natronoarchaeum mannanilyticum TaxID=926360 RepID=A0AAV3TAZ2_9EURY
MSVPGAVESALDGEDVAAEVPLGGEDVLYITPTRTLIYRGEGLLSDETVEEYPHDAERLTVKEGRRKTRFSLEYPLEGTKEFTLPSNSAESALHPVLAGIMNAGGVTDPGETVVKTFRFSELTLVVTSERLVKHIGEVVWDEDYEEFHYADVTGLTFEEGSVATQIVLEVDGRQQRIKAPKEHAREVRERLTQALCNYYDVSSIEELRAAIAPDEEVADAGDDAPAVAFGEGVDPLDANPPAPDDEDLVSDPDNATSDADTTADAGSASSATSDANAGETVNAGSADAESTPVASDAAASTAGQSESAASEGIEARSADAANERASESATDSVGQADGAQRQRNDATAGAAENRTRESSAASEQRAADADEAESGSEPEFDFEEAGFEPAESDEDIDAADDVAAEIAELRAVVEEQNERLDQQRRAIERLVEELSRGR